MENKQKKPKWKKILGWILFIWGILGIISEAVFFIYFGHQDFLQLFRLGVSGIFIVIGYGLKKEE
jgi:uncharacterized membrane protein HdeD (DUF308 family)